MAKGTKTLRIAAFLAVKEGGHVGWYFLFTRGGEFNFLVILDSVRGYHSMLKDNRIDGWGRTRVGRRNFCLAGRSQGETWRRRTVPEGLLP